MDRTETAAFLARVAEVMEEAHTPFAVTCKDPGCNCKSAMRDADWTRYYGMLAISEWLRSSRATDALTPKIASPTEGLPDELLWDAVFGTNGESWPWWVSRTFLDGDDWSVIGRVRLEIEHPDNPHDSIEKIVTMADVREAIDTLAREGKHHDVCTGKFPIGPEMDAEWDACVSDLVLQTMVLGEVVYG